MYLLIPILIKKLLMNCIFVSSTTVLETTRLLSNLKIIQKKYCNMFVLVSYFWRRGVGWWHWWDTRLLKWGTHSVKKMSQNVSIFKEKRCGTYSKPKKPLARASSCSCPSSATAGSCVAATRPAAALPPAPASAPSPSTNTLKFIKPT